MSDIFILIRRQDNVALTSIGGIPFVTQLRQGSRLLAEETVDLIYADAGFDDLPPGHYTIAVRQERVEPKEAVYDIEIEAEDEVILLRFTYLESARVLLEIQASREKRL